MGKIVITVAVLATIIPLVMMGVIRHGHDSCDHDDGICVHQNVCNLCDDDGDCIHKRRLCAEHPLHKSCSCNRNNKEVDIFNTIDVDDILAGRTKKCGCKSIDVDRLHERHGLCDHGRDVCVVSGDLSLCDHDDGICSGAPCVHSRKARAVKALKDRCDCNDCLDRRWDDCQHKTCNHKEKICNAVKNKWNNDEELRHKVGGWVKNRHGDVTIERVKGQVVKVRELKNECDCDDEFRHNVGKWIKCRHNNCDHNRGICNAAKYISENCNCDRDVLHLVGKWRNCKHNKCDHGNNICIDNCGCDDCLNSGLLQCIHNKCDHKNKICRASNYIANNCDCDNDVKHLVGKWIRCKYGNGIGLDGVCGCNSCLTGAGPCLHSACNHNAGLCGANNCVHGLDNCASCDSVKIEVLKDASLLNGVGLLGNGCGCHNCVTGGDCLHGTCRHDDGICEVRGCGCSSCSNGDLGSCIHGGCDHAAGVCGITNCGHGLGGSCGGCDNVQIGILDNLDLLNGVGLLGNGCGCHNCVTGGDCLHGTCRHDDGICGVGGCGCSSCSNGDLGSCIHGGCDHTAGVCGITNCGHGLGGSCGGCDNVQIGILDNLDLLNGIGLLGNGCGCHNCVTGGDCLHGTCRHDDGICGVGGCGCSSCSSGDLGSCIHGGCDHAAGVCGITNCGHGLGGSCGGCDNVQIGILDNLDLLNGIGLLGNGCGCGPHRNSCGCGGHCNCHTGLL